MLNFDDVIRVGTPGAQVALLPFNRQAAQHPPHTAERVIAQPFERLAHDDQTPTARRWHGRRATHWRLGGGVRCMAQWLAQFALMAVDGTGRSLTAVWMGTQP